MLVTPPLDGEGSQLLQSLVMLVTLPLGSQDQSQSLMVTPPVGHQSLLMTLCNLREEGGLRHSLGP